MTEAWAVIVAGGSGSRFSSTQDKLLVPVAGKPVLQRTLEAFLATSDIAGIVLVAASDALETYQTLVQTAFPMPRVPVLLTSGGSTRRDSVYQGLLALPQNVDLVAIHDAARPLITPDLITATMHAVLQGAAGAILGLPIVDTVKSLDPATGHIRNTIDRNMLWRAQTPQTFRREIIVKAHQMVPAETPVTDDAQLLELAGLGPILPIPGDERNLKVTTPPDIQRAEAFLAGSP